MELKSLYITSSASTDRKKALPGRTTCAWSPPSSLSITHCVESNRGHSQLFVSEERRAKRSVFAPEWPGGVNSWLIAAGIRGTLTPAIDGRFERELRRCGVQANRCRMGRLGRLACRGRPSSGLEAAGRRTGARTLPATTSSSTPARVLAVRRSIPTSRDG